MELYERNFTDYAKAKEAADITGGTISRFYSMDENGEPIIVYCVKYRVLF